jgi:predicted nucleotidyltransferase
MSIKIPVEEMEKYKRTARRRWEHEQMDRQARREKAWQLAGQAAALLKRGFDVERVAVFGSLIHPGRFNASSDVDLAAWGLTPTNWLKAMAAVRNLSDEIDLNLVDVECVSPELLKVIEREGVDL